MNTLDSLQIHAVSVSPEISALASPIIIEAIRAGAGVGGVVGAGAGGDVAGGHEAPRKICGKWTAIIIAAEAIAITTAVVLGATMGMK